MLGLVPSASLLGVDGHAVTVEVHVSSGLPSFTVVGSPDSACREASGRVRAALLSSGCAWPSQRVTVNLAPPTVRKIGSGLDLAIAIAVLVASEQIEPGAVEGLAFLGELGLDGSLRPVPGTLCLAESLGDGAVVLPEASAAEAGLVSGRSIYGLSSLAGVVACLRGEEPWPESPRAAPVESVVPLPDLADVRGQPIGRYALEVAAAGGHHLLMMGPPGAGKTMLASRLPGLLPPLTDQAALETTRIHSAAGLGLPPAGLVRQPPFRAPHHGASSVALVGGGSATMRPGEISAACNGVLFLDELAEFAGHVLDALRQPLEEGVVRVARAAATVTFPARFLLVAAMNPCPVRLRRAPGRLSLLRCSPGPLPPPTVGTAARSVRPARRGHETVGLRPDGPRPLRADGDRAQPRPGGPGDRRGSRHRDERRHPGRPPRRARALGARGGRGARAGAPQWPPLRAGTPSGSSCGPHGRRPAGRHRRAHLLPRRDGAQPSSRRRTGHARPGPVGMTDERDLGFSALLAGHAAVGPRRLRELLSEGSAEAGWIAMGGDPRIDPLPVAGALHAAGVEMLVEGGPGYPDRLARLPGSSGPPVRPGRPHGAGAPSGRDRGHAPVHRERRRVRP